MVKQITSFQPAPGRVVEVYERLEHSNRWDAETEGHMSEISMFSDTYDDSVSEITNDSFLSYGSSLLSGDGSQRMIFEFATSDDKRPMMPKHLGSPKGSPRRRRTIERISDNRPSMPERQLSDYSLNIEDDVFEENQSKGNKSSTSKNGSKENMAKSRRPPRYPKAALEAAGLLSAPLDHETEPKRKSRRSHTSLTSSDTTSTASMSSRGSCSSRGSSSRGSGSTQGSCSSPGSASSRGSSPSTSSKRRLKRQSIRQLTHKSISSSSSKKKRTSNSSTNSSQPRRQSVTVKTANTPYQYLPRSQQVLAQKRRSDQTARRSSVKDALQIILEE